MTEIRQIYLTEELDHEEVEQAYLGKQLQGNEWDILISGESADVYAPDGTPLIKFRHNVLSPAAAKAGWQALREAARPTANRGMAAGQDMMDRNEGLVGEIGEIKGTRHRRLKADGTLSNTLEAPRVNSGIVGYYGRTTRMPYCRTTAYSLRNPEKFASALPLIKEIDAVFKSESPERYQAQLDMIEQVNPDFKISGTAFTTITVNKNWQTACHYDAGDFEGGFGVMTALRAGAYDGCYLVWPKYRVAADMHTLDVCLANVHELHGNSPFIEGKDAYERISLVLYMRPDMLACGSAEEELELAKHRHRGDGLGVSDVT